jgi:hypothetical protein
LLVTLGTGGAAPAVCFTGKARASLEPQTTVAVRPRQASATAAHSLPLSDPSQALGGRRRCQSSVMTTLPLARPCSTYVLLSRAGASSAPARTTACRPERTSRVRLPRRSQLSREQQSREDGPSAYSRGAGDVRGCRSMGSPIQVRRWCNAKTSLTDRSGRQAGGRIHRGLRVMARRGWPCLIVHRL